MRFELEFQNAGAVDLARHVATKDDAGQIRVPAFVEIGGSLHDIHKVKGDPRLRDAFVSGLRSELGALNQIRKGKMRLIAYLQQE